MLSYDGYCLNFSRKLDISSAEHKEKWSEEDYPLFSGWGIELLNFFT
jgi:hypothetical protein